MRGRARTQGRIAIREDTPISLSAAIEWEVNRGAAGATDNAGGGFDASVASPGTDYTYGVGYALITWLAAGGTYTNDLAATNAANSVLTSASRNFIAADVGNVIHITAGTKFTAGWYTIISVATNAATLDRNCTDTTGDATGGSGYLGGAFLTIGGAGAAHGSVGGQHIWVKYNASAYTAASTSSNVATGRLTLAAGTAGAPTLLRGYETTRGDETANRPTFAWGVNAGNGYLVTTNASAAVENLILDGVTGTYTGTAGLNGGAAGVLRRCWFKAFNYRAASVGTGHVVDCEFSGCANATEPVLRVTSNTVNIDGCYIHDNTQVPIIVTTGLLTVRRTIIDTTTTYAAIVATGAAYLDIDGLTIYSSGSYGIDLQAAPTMATIANSHFQLTGAVAINTAAVSPMVRLINCSFYSNTGGNYSGTNILARNVVGAVVISDGDPLTDAANGDFRPNATPLRGALMRAAGFPQTYPGNATANKPDIGAYQHADPVIVTPAADSLYAGKTVTSDGVALVTGTLHASTISSSGAANGGSNLAAGDLKSGTVVDDVTGTLVGGTPRYGDMTGGLR